MEEKPCILEFYNSNGSYSITLANIVKYDKCFEYIKRIVWFFSKGSELFLGNYKVDGLNLSRRQFREYATEIPKFFREKGDYYPIRIKSGRNNTLISELSACRAKNCEETYNIFEKVFNFYLETIVFCPKVEWDFFVSFFAEYTRHSSADYVLNKYADFVFSYVDSGDFSITFDPLAYNHVTTCNKIKQIIIEVNHGMR